MPSYRRVGRTQFKVLIDCTEPKELVWNTQETEFVFFGVNTPAIKQRSWSTTTIMKVRKAEIWNDKMSHTLNLETDPGREYPTLHSRMSHMSSCTKDKQKTHLRCIVTRWHGSFRRPRRLEPKKSKAGLLSNEYEIHHPPRFLQWIKWLIVMSVKCLKCEVRFTFD